jgi:hypothetical protein
VCAPTLGAMRTALWLIAAELGMVLSVLLLARA